MEDQFLPINFVCVFQTIAVAAVVAANDFARLVLQASSSLMMMKMTRRKQHTRRRWRWRRRFVTAPSLNLMGDQ